LMTRSAAVIRLAIVTVVIACVPFVASAQSLDEVRKWFDTGEYQHIVDAAGGSQDPRVQYVVAQSQQKLRRTDDARRVYEQLAARPEGDPWQAIGRSGVAVLASNAAAAVQDGDQAVARAGDLAEAHYQRGLALSARQDFGAAAEAFQKAGELD